MFLAASHSNLPTPPANMPTFQPHTPHAQQPKRLAAAQMCALQDWCETMARRLRTMCRHVSKAEVRSATLPWLVQLELAPRASLPEEPVAG